MNKKGFTLIELLVGISISTILMLSVGYLISGGISNITSQEKTLQNSSDFASFENKIQNLFLNIDTNFTPIKTSSGVIVKLKPNYDEGGFAYIGETIENEFYCNYGSENIQTKHIFIKTFIPDFDIDIQKSHKIDGVGKGFFGYNKIDTNGIVSEKVYLNNPTGTGSNGMIEFISDTLNNRILYKSGSKSYELLNENDGILEPTGLYYDSGDKALYIANSGLGEILKYSSKKYTTIPNLTLTGITANSSSFEISFYNSNGNYDIQNPINISDINFTNYTKQSGDYININNNKLTYSFSGGINQNFNNETISINNLANFTETGSYFINIKMGSFQKFYSYFTQSDGNLLTKNDNTLEVIEKTNKYPTSITDSSTFNYFLDGSYSNMDYNKKHDYILKSPIKKLDINYDSSKLILNFDLDYYNRYNCYNLEEKTERKFILKKNFK